MAIKKNELVKGDRYQLYGREVAVFVGYSDVSAKAVFRFKDGSERAVCMDCVYKHVGKENTDAE